MNRPTRCSKCGHTAHVGKCSHAHWHTWKAGGTIIRVTCACTHETHPREKKASK